MKWSAKAIVPALFLLALVTFIADWRPLLLDAFWYFNPKKSSSITLSETVELKNPLFLDARTKEEYLVSHIKDAVWVGEDTSIVFQLEFSGNDTVVVYCSVGYRSGIHTEFLRDQGLKNVYNLKKGLFQWANKGYPVYSGSSKTHYVHPYDNIWGQFIRDRSSIREDP